MLKIEIKTFFEYVTSSLSLNTVLITEPQIRAFRVQAWIPVHELRRGNADFGLNPEAVVAGHDSVVFRAGRNSFRVNGV